jgi:uroporphyrinogen decarboxylase
MTPRERIIATLEHREPDCLAIDFSGTECSSVHMIAYDKLRKYLGIEPRPMRGACLIQMLAEADNELQDYFNADAAALYFYPKQWRTWDSGWGFDVEVPDLWRPEMLDNGQAVIRDANGVIRLERPAGGYYFDPVSFVFSDIKSSNEFDAYPKVFDRWDWPAVTDETVDQYAARAKDLYASTDRAVVASWRMHYLQAGQIMRGYEQFMVDLLIDEPLVRSMLDRLHAAYMERAETFLKAMADSVDIIFLTDDLGTQNAPLLNPATYRKLIKPYWTELITLIKQYNKKVLMHSCGAISEFIPDLIEMGVDAVNPVQITAAGMEPARLKKEFGDDITFWGGGVSTQGVLDKGTVQEVQDEVKCNVDTFAPGGGFVFTQVHNIQYNVPSENIVAAYKAAREV